MAVTGFSAELFSLKQLYFISLKGQQLLSEHIKSLPESGRENDIFPGKYSPRMNVPHYLDAKSFIRSQYGSYLRETIFVRLVSALEVLFVDSAVTIFLSDKSALRGRKIELSSDLLSTYSDLDQLWAKIIKDESRNLNGRRFSDIIDYYDKKFEINIKKFESPDVIEEMFERRHLLVHALGHTDEIYRMKHRYPHVTIGVDEEYLLKCFDLLENFHEFLRRSVYKRVNKNNSLDESSRHYQVRLRIGKITSEARSLFEPTLEIEVKKIRRRLADILKNKSDSGNELSMVLSGERSFVGKYIELIKKAEFENKLRLMSRDVISRGHRTKLSNETLHEIYKLLGPRPWKTGISDEIAKKIGVSKTQVGYAISLILDYEEYFQDGT